VRFPAGTALEMVMTKWGERPHWEFAATYLGADDHGEWLGFAPGAWFHRPGMEFHTTNTQVTLLPRDGWWVATFHGDDGPARHSWPHLGNAAVEVYVDMATPAVWDGSTVRSIDLDLDVIRGTTGVVHVDDEDEFAEHQVAFGYPADVVVAAQTACDDVRRWAEEWTAPFDGLTPRVWLDRVACP